MIEKIDKNDKARGLSTYAIIDKVNEIIDFLNGINQWISTNVRLPECENGAETDALLFRLKTGTVIAGYFGRGGVWRDKYFRHYWDHGEGWDASDVTHWMPLPAQPTEKEK